MMDLNVDAYNHNSNNPNEYQNLDIYKRISGIEDEEEMDDMLEELIDRFGDVPRNVQQLLQIAGLKALAHSAYVTAVEQKGEEFRFTMYEKAKVNPQRIPPLIQSYRGNLVFKAEAVPYFVYYKKGRNKKEKDETVLELVKKLLNDIKSLLSYRGNLVFKAEAVPYFVYYKKGRNKKEKDETVLELVKKLLNDIKSLLEEKKDVIMK